MRLLFLFSILFSYRAVQQVSLFVCLYFSVILNILYGIYSIVYICFCGCFNFYVCFFGKLGKLAVAKEYCLR